MNTGQLGNRRINSVLTCGKLRFEIDTLDRHIFSMIFKLANKVYIGDQCVKDCDREVSQ